MEMRVIVYLLVSMLVEKPAYPLFFIRNLIDDGEDILGGLRNEGVFSALGCNLAGE